MLFWRLLGLAAVVWAQTRVTDRIKSLPGITFEYGHRQYSGYLPAKTTGNQLFYWFLESQNKPAEDPLILWLNGGPGCSSLTGLLTELGPFFPNPDGETLFENVYSWNKLGNILFVESPRDVGFSYGKEDDREYSDELTTKDLVESLVEFIKRFPEYQKRDFYVTGESYAGVYIPRLVDRLIEMIQADPNSFPVNLVGAAIGNGILNEKHQCNSYMNLAFYRGISDYDDMKTLRDVCCQGDGDKEAYEYCNFYQYVEQKPNGDVEPREFPENRKLNVCGVIVKKYAYTGLFKYYEKYNHVQSCYFADASSRPTFLQSVIRDRFAQKLDDFQFIPDGNRKFIDQGARRNLLSTDALGGFPCFGNDAMTKYLNTEEVKKAIHVNTEALKDRKWVKCDNDVVSANYERQTRDTTYIFESIANRKFPFRWLIYNGDADGVCNYLGDEWFVEDLAEKIVFDEKTARQRWTFQRTPQYLAAHAGYFKSFSNEKWSLDFVTVSGAGHLVPLDRPGPSYQMFKNWLEKEKDYNKTLAVEFTPKPFLNEYRQPLDDKISRAEADRIYYLPGVTFDYDFLQHSGYLKGVDGNYLHYWLIKSEASPATDPLILWLNGGPGCSSLGGLLTELGPFRPNPDGVTLSQNVYSWNRAANILFLEGPRNVGFSYQNTTENPDEEYDDEKTAVDNFLALRDFYSIYPEFVNRPFYVMGESYGGIYVPTLTNLLIQKYQANEFPGLNLVGMAVGNGILSAIEQLRSNAPLMYNRGFLGKDEWDRAVDCCNGDYNTKAFCDIEKFVYLNESGIANPIDPADDCHLDVAAVVQKEWEYFQTSNVYNTYQDCYQQKAYVFGARTAVRRNSLIEQMTALKSKTGSQNSVNTLDNVFSTDNQGGFPCFAMPAMENWLNTPDVRAALHIPFAVQNFTDCNEDINNEYIQLYNDTGPVFDEIIASKHPLRILVFNGDLDLACNFIGDQWFIENLAEEHNLHITEPHSPWTIHNKAGGYAKQFKGKEVTIDLLTVKGAGHLVPTDRPEAALQMIMNFIGHKSYNSSVIYRDISSPLKKQYKIEEEYSKAVGPISAADVAREYPNSLRENKTPKTAAPLPPPPPQGRNQNKIKNEDLPGLNFQPATQYSGYLTVAPKVHLHYWYIEAQNKPAAPETPLILWLNGGPGCSSLGGFFTELGPFQITKDGKRLVENLFAWNKIGNLLVLESPRGVGFSYAEEGATPSPTDPYNDSLTADQTVEALRLFYNRFSELRQKDLYVTGESYAGVYVPTLVDRLLRKENSNIKLKGFAVGNGILSKAAQLNSAVHLLYYRGLYDLPTYKALLSCCPKPEKSEYGEQIPCNFAKYVTFSSNGDAHARNEPGNEKFNECARLVELFGFTMVWDSINSAYNTYQDCYVEEEKTFGRKGYPVSRYKRSVDFSKIPPLRNEYTFVDQAKLINKNSTDSRGGFTCTSNYNIDAYLNQENVKKAIHVTEAIKWNRCDEDINKYYVQENHDTTKVFESILNQLKSARRHNFKILIYNGDADMACEHLGDEWFISSLAKKRGMIPSTREPWEYKRPVNETNTFSPRLAGFVRHFSTGYAVMDVLTVKGAGHMVPRDRPGPAFQMIKNFILQKPELGKELINYSIPIDAEVFQKQPVDVQPSPPPTPSRKEMDEVFNLPGLTFNINFRQYSGYLETETKGNYLHYWLVESQSKPDSDPLVLWLTGGPGCSAMGALLGENGPFFVNPDGRTLFENVFSWNKVANVLYLESPRDVGLSYQNRQENPDDTYDDLKSAKDVAEALADFLKVHDYKGRDFFITGESYAGIYIPTTANKILSELDKTDNGIYKDLNLAFKGFLIGNPYISKEWNRKTLLDFYYFHGLLSKPEYQDLRKCCNNGKGPDADVCDLSQVDAECEKKVDAMTDVQLDKYNIYQQCYDNTVQTFGSAAELFHDQIKSDYFHHSANLRKQIREKIIGRVQTPYVHKTEINYASTDSNGGYLCYMTDRVADYLNQKHVRDVLHIPEVVGKWTFCKDIKYNANYNDMTGVFGEIAASSYVKNLGEPFHILLHNGDNDLVCDLMQAEYFVEHLGLETVKERQPWKVRMPGIALEDAAVGGYQKQFKWKNSNINLDLLTVKGSGHFVPIDTPLAGAQLFTNFVHKRSSIEDTVDFTVNRQALKGPYKPLNTHEPPTRAPFEGPPPEDDPKPPPKEDDPPPPKPGGEAPKDTTPSSAPRPLATILNLLMFMLPLFVFRLS